MIGSAFTSAGFYLRERGCVYSQMSVVIISKQDEISSLFEVNMRNILATLSRRLTPKIIYSTKSISKSI